MIILYGPRAAPFVEKVARGLALKKLAFELREPSSPEDFRRWSPETGLLPVIDIDGERVHDSTAILLRVDALVPEPPLLGEEPRTARNQLRLARWVDESFSWYWTRWQRSRPQRSPEGVPLAGEARGEVGRAHGAEPPRPAGVSLRSWVASRMRRPSADPKAEHELAREIGHRLDDLERLLWPRPFFYADRISIADLAVYSMLKGLAVAGIPGARRALDRHDALLDFLARVERETGD